MSLLDVMLSVIINLIVNEKLPPLRVGRLESENPIVLGGMSTGLTGAELAATVANEGGFGTIGGVGLGMVEGIKRQKEYFKAGQVALKQEIQDALEISNNGNVGVNLMVAVTDYEALVKVAVKNGVKFIASGAGLPLRLPEYVEKSRVPGQPTPELIPIVSGVRAAKLILKRWERNRVLPAAFIVETPNTAGGHLGVTKTEDIGKTEFSLGTVVPELVEFLGKYTSDYNDKYRLGLEAPPVIAAGGVWDRNDVLGMLRPEIGAKGVQMATRFIASDECNASHAFKDRHVDNTDPIVVIKSPVGMPGRAIENDFIRRVNEKSEDEEIDLGSCVNCLRVCEHAKNPLASFCIIRALYNVRVGDVENGILFTGSNGDRLKADREKGIHSVRQIIQELFEVETKKTLRSLPYRNTSVTDFQNIRIGQ